MRKLIRYKIYQYNILFKLVTHCRLSKSEHPAGGRLTATIQCEAHGLNEHARWASQNVLPVDPEVEGELYLMNPIHLT